MLFGYNCSLGNNVRNTAVMRFVDLWTLKPRTRRWRCADDAMRPCVMSLVRLTALDKTVFFATGKQKKNVKHRVRRSSKPLTKL